MGFAREPELTVPVTGRSKLALPGHWQEVLEDCVTREKRQDKRMERSTDRILTTHTGTLSRPAELAELLIAKETGAEPWALSF